MPYQFVYAIVMLIISYAISYYSAKRMQKSQGATPQNAEIPTAEEGASIPVVFGTVLMKNAQILDYFDPKTKEIKS